MSFPIYASEDREVTQYKSILNKWVLYDMLIFRKYFFTQATFKGWMDIMYAAVDSREVRE